MGTADELTRLREGSVLDYDMQTWEVTEYESHSDAGWPADEWTLKSGTDILFLEHEYDDSDVFRLSKPAKISEIVVEDARGQRRPFLTAIRDSPESVLGAPSTIVYQDEEYTLAEEDARVETKQTAAEGKLVTTEDSKIMGVCGGIAQYVGWPSAVVRLLFIGILIGVNFIIPCALMTAVVGGYFLAGFILPEESDISASSGSGRTHYWVYEKGENFVALECWGANDWDAYAGREVEPYEFDNLLPGESSS